MIILSLFWRRFNTAGIVSGIAVGTVAAIGLVLVSPNMTYPKKIAEDAKKVVPTLERKQAEGVLLADKDRSFWRRPGKTIRPTRTAARSWGWISRSSPLKNPGIVSVPLGFLAAIFGCLAVRDRRAEEMFDEMYVRQNTGIGIAKAVDH